MNPVRRPCGRGALAALALAVLAVALAAWWMAAPAGERSSSVGHLAPLPATARWSLLSAGDQDAAKPLSPTTAGIDALEQRLYGQGSLQGTVPDGEWGVDAQGQLRPTLALRRRFDHYLAALGEATVDELTVLMQAHATRDVGEAATRQIREVWDRYVEVQRHPYRITLRLDDPHTWEAALAERQQVRRERLGLVWAEAFYREEEAALRTHIQAARGESRGIERVAAQTQARLLGPPAGGVDPGALHEQRVREFGPEAAERLRQEDLAWADWERRLAEAGQLIEALRQAPELSPVQREAAIAGLIESRFTPAERLRARSLLLR